MSMSVSGFESAVWLYVYQGLNCPYLEGTSSEVVKEVVFHPGEARIRLLTWMAAR